MNNFDLFLILEDNNKQKMFIICAVFTLISSCKNFLDL